MNITQIMENKELNATEKLSKLADVIAEARKAYGNEEMEITCPEVLTTEGVMSMKYLSAEDKLVEASKAINGVLSTAIAANECNEGVILDKAIEVGLATDPILCNLTTTTGSKYF